MHPDVQTGILEWVKDAPEEEVVRLTAEHEALVLREAARCVLAVLRCTEALCSWQDGRRKLDGHGEGSL